jgi:hypothetical protein
MVRNEVGATLEGTPELVAGAGPAVIQEWLLEADMTAYRVVVAFVSDGPMPVGVVRKQGDRVVPLATLSPLAYVMCTIAGGELSTGRRTPRWSVSGGGAWYPFQTEGYLTEMFVAEKFRLNAVDAFHVTRLIAAALGRPTDASVGSRTAE